MAKRISVRYECNCKASGMSVPIACPEHRQRWVEQWEGLHEIHQPKDGKSCGQACAAMVLGISLEESIELFGHDSGTYPRELSAVIRLSGMSCKPNLKRTRGKTLPKRGILNVGWCIGGRVKRRGRHWMVIWDGKIYDPSPGKMYSKLAPKGGAKILSYLEIEA